MTTAVAEMSMMTLKEAETAFTGWQSKLDAARADLADFEQGLGQFALANGPMVATQELARRQVEVRMCEAGLAGANTQIAEVRRQEQLARVQGIRAEAAELERQATEFEAFYSEWQPKVATAYQGVINNRSIAESRRRQADEIERTYGKVEA